jgi:DNA-binding LacI/PurR family transcriptional regulator
MDGSDLAARRGRSDHRRVTIVEVAHAAGVSVGTASDALNAKGRVASPTRERVRRVARELGYRPSSGARGLATGRTMTLGLRVGTGPTIPDAGFFLELLNGASRAAAARGYALLMTAADLDEAALVDGVVVVDPVVAADVNRPRAAGLPVVTVGRAPSNCGPVPHVDIDHAAVVGSLLDHVATRHPTGPAWLLSLPDRPSFNSDIEQSFGDWSARVERPTRVLHCKNSAVAVTRVIERELARGATPTVVCSVLDRQAAWAQRALLRAGLRIPQDVAIASATDGEAARISDPPITAIDASGAQTGSAAVELLTRWIEHDAEAPVNMLVEATLVARASSAS